MEGRRWRILSVRSRYFWFLAGGAAARGHVLCLRWGPLPCGLPRDGLGPGLGRFPDASAGRARRRSRGPLPSASAGPGRPGPPAALSS